MGSIYLGASLVPWSPSPGCASFPSPRHRGRRSNWSHRNRQRCTSTYEARVAQMPYRIDRRHVSDTIYDISYHEYNEYAYIYIYTYICIYIYIYHFWHGKPSLKRPSMDGNHPMVVVGTEWIHPRIPRCSPRRRSLNHETLWFFWNRTLGPYGKFKNVEITIGTKKSPFDHWVRDHTCSTPIF